MDSALNEFLLSDTGSAPADRSIQISAEAFADGKIVFNYLVALQDKQLTKHILEEKFPACIGATVAHVSVVDIIEYFLRHCDGTSLTRLKKILNATLTASPETTSGRSLKRAKRKQARQSYTHRSSNAGYSSLREQNQTGIQSDMTQRLERRGVYMQATDSSDEDAQQGGWRPVDADVDLEQAAQHVPSSIMYIFSYLDTLIVCNALLTCFSTALTVNPNGRKDVRIPSCYKKLLMPADYAFFTADQHAQMESEDEPVVENTLLQMSAFLPMPRFDSVVIPSGQYLVAATSRRTQKPAADSAAAQIYSDESAAEYTENISAAKSISPKKLRFIQERLQSLTDLCLATQRFIEKAPDATTLAIFRWLNDCYDQANGENLEQHFRQSLFKGESLSTETVVTYFLRSASVDTLNRLQKKVNNFRETMQSVRVELSHARRYSAIIQATCAAIVQVFTQHIPRDALANKTRYAFFLAPDNALLRLRALTKLHEACEQEPNARLLPEQSIVAQQQIQARNTITLNFFQQFYYDNTGRTLVDYFPASQMRDDQTQQIIYFFLRNCAIEQSLNARGLSGLTAYFTTINAANQESSSQDVGHCQRVLECFERYIIRSAVGAVDFDSPLSYVGFLAHYAQHAQVVMRKARACENADEYYKALSDLWHAATGLKRSYDQHHPSVVRPVISTRIADVVPLENIARAKKITAVAVAATINYFFLMCVYSYFNWRFVLQSLLDTQRWLDVDTANTDDDADTPNLTDVTSNIAEDITSMIALLFSINELIVLLMTHTPINNVYAFLISAKQTKSWPRQLFIETPIFLSRFLMHISSSLAVAALIDHYVSKEKNPLTIVGFSTMMTLSLINTVFFATPAHTHQTVFNRFIFKSIRVTPELSLQAGAMLLGFICAQALVITIMAEQSAVLLSYTEETNPYVMATMLGVVIIAFLGGLFSQAAAVFHQFIRPEYLALTKDDYILSRVRPIQKSRLLWDIAKQFVFQDAVLIAMLAMLIQGDFAKPSALRLFFIIFVGALVMAQSIYCSYRRQLLDNLIAVNPYLKTRLNPDDTKTAVRLTATQKARQAIDAQISKLTQTKWPLPRYKLVMSYISALNRALILPFAVVKFNDLLDYFDCALDGEQLIAMTVLLGLYLMNWTITYHHKRMHTTADFIRLLHNMKLLKSENADLIADEGTPLMRRNLSMDASHRDTREGFRGRGTTPYVSTQPLAEQAEQVAKPSFFQELRLNLTGTYYRYSVNDWLELAAVSEADKKRQGFTF